MKTENIKSLIIMALLIVVSLLIFKGCQPSPIKTYTTTKHTTHTDTIYKLVDNTITQTKWKYIKDTLIIVNNAPKAQITQSFPIGDSLLNGSITTIANDTVNQIKFDYTANIPTIIKVDSIIVDRVVENTEYKDKYTKLKAKQPLRIILSGMAGAIVGIFGYQMLK